MGAVVGSRSSVREARIAITFLTCLLLAAPALAWTVVTLDAEGDVGFGNDIKVDAAGHVHIGYSRVDGDDPKIKYAVFDGSNWSTQIIDEERVASWVPLDLDGAGRPFIAYTNYFEAGLFIAHFNGASWEHDAIETEDGVMEVPDLAVHNGWPHVAYHWNTDLRYGYKDAGGWHLATIETANEGWGPDTDLALDAAGNAHILFFEGFVNGGVLRYATNAGGGWDVSDVEGNLTDVGGHASITVGGDGAIHISYTDTVALKHAVLSGGWQIEVVDASTEYQCGFYTSIGVDSQGYCHISYSEITNGYMKYAHQDAAGWHTEVVDATGNASDSTALDLGPDDSVHISYYDWEQDDLKYAHQGGSATDLGVTLTMPAHHFTPGSTCSLTATLHNSGAAMANVPLFVILDVYGQYWFWPAWQPGLDYQLVNLPSGQTPISIIPAFTWPQTGADEAQGIIFWGAMLNGGMTEVLGGLTGLGQWTFGFGPF